LVLVTFVTFVAVVTFVFVFVGSAQDVTDAQLEAASGGRTVRLGPSTSLGAGPTRVGAIADVPLEVYVARVLAGEAEPKGPDGEFQALAIAIRTYALVNAGRHARDGFDVCDSTHCQVPRVANALTRAAALATVGQVLTWNGAPAEVFYSASCGGRSESPDQVWPGASYPYMRSAPDDVHDEDLAWTFDLTLQEAQRILAGIGFEGRLRDVDVDDRSASGRATRLHLSGMQPDVIAGDQFRLAIGAARVRSTAFSVEQRGSTLRFTGRGYGHGVGMCVIGAGRRATRGEGVRAILAHYYPGLDVTRLDVTRATNPVGRVLSGAPGEPDPSMSSGSSRAPSRDDRARPTPEAPRGGIVALVPGTSSMTNADVVRLAARAHDDLAAVLGMSIAPLTVRVHESLEGFRLATGRPWWVSSVSAGTSIDLVPAALLAQRDGFEAALRVAVAELLVADALKDRPAWVRAGAARYFGRNRSAAPPRFSGRERCPANAELTLAISAPAQRDAETRAEACFAREYARTKDWRAVR
jgi:stage II sporulation protein D